MARGRRYNTNHAVRGGDWSYSFTEPTKRVGFNGPSWCGQDRVYNTMTNLPEGEDPHAYSRRTTDCPKCAKAIGKARLKQLADRVELREMQVPTGQYGKRYKSCHELFIDGQLLAHVVMDNGWGTVWELRELTADKGRDFGRVASTVPSLYSKVSADEVFQPAHCRSKELMACAGLRLRDAGGLLTLEEMAAKDELRRVRLREQNELAEADRAKRAVERERKDKLRAERATLALDALAAALLNPGLSNMERAGLTAAQEIISGKDVM